LNLWSREPEKEVLQTRSIKDLTTLPKAIRNLFMTSLEIPWQYHLLHQRAFQKYTDNAVSKTINLQEDVTVNTISKIFITAWEYKLKGITIYRYGSKDHQILQKCSLNTSKYC
ncbi:MAG: ribonucleoside-diphosphate reductase, adenosylcobalamin-dependent, partial [Ignavibacteriae bacterium]|nr:ribonucleoside-diphosphate reductase, adenosylcobalamin-dependent [Ignavibacteriota bacterium]